jgi:branched-chain amino acid aminotransferase
MGQFIYNGKFYPDESAVVHADNRGLRYGDGLFETIKSINNNLLFMEDHFNRLWHGMVLLQFNFPKHFTREFLYHQIMELLKKNKHHKTCRVRLTVFRGEGGLYEAADQPPHYLVQSWELPDDTGAWNSNGLVLGVYNDVKKSCDILCNIKHNNFLPYVMAAGYAKKQQWNDAVLLNSKGRICDTTITNIFLIKHEMVYTPALQEGCIAGVMRKNIIEFFAESDHPIKECELTVADLLDADEVFLTNTIHSIRWVQSIGDKKYSNVRVQKIYNEVFLTIK